MSLAARAAGLVSAPCCGLRQCGSGQPPRRAQSPRGCCCLGCCLGSCALWHVSCSWLFLSKSDCLIQCPNLCRWRPAKYLELLLWAVETGATLGFGGETAQSAERRCLRDLPCFRETRARGEPRPLLPPAAPMSSRGGFIGAPRQNWQPPSRKLLHQSSGPCSAAPPFHTNSPSQTPAPHQGMRDLWGAQRYRLAAADLE